MGEWVAEFTAVHAQDVAAYDLKTAAAIAAAMAKTHGWKLIRLLPRAEYDREKK
jgi:hypothetical protein